MTSFTPLLAHALSPENPWIGPMTMAAAVLLVTFVLVVVDRVQVDAPGDLLLPAAAAVLVAGLAGSVGGDFVLDQGRWAVPAGIVVLVALLVAAFRDVDYGPTSRSTFAVLGVAVVAAVALFQPLDRAWFPADEDEPLPIPDDAVVAAEVVQPLGADGVVVVRVTLEGATFGDNVGVERPEDPETGLSPRFQVGPVYLQPPIPDDCAAAPTCTEAEFELTLPSGFVDDPPETLIVEMLTADRLPFAPPVQARFDLPVEE